MLFLFDTNIVLIYLRNIVMEEIIDAAYNPFIAGNRAMVSVVSIGELKALALRNRWGKSRIGDLGKLLSRFVIVDLNTEESPIVMPKLMPSVRAD